MMLMQCVTTPGDPITARAKMDFMEMEQSALVSIAICNLFFIPPNPIAFSDWRRTCHVPRV